MGFCHRAIGHGIPDGQNINAFGDVRVPIAPVIVPGHASPDPMVQNRVGFNGDRQIVHRIKDQTYSRLRQEE